MKGNEPVSFKDSIYRMFLKYAITPAFAIAFAGVVLTFGLWGYTTVDTIRDSNEEISAEMELVIRSYEEVLETMAAQTELVTKPLNKEVQVRVFEDIYKLSNQLGYKAKIYIFDKDYEPVLASSKEIPSDLNGDAVSNWGIFRQMKNEPDRMAVKVVQNTEDASSVIYMGRPMKENGSVTGYIIFTIDSAEFRVLLTRVPAQTVITDQYGWIYQANNYDMCDNLNRMSRAYESEKGYIRCNGKYLYLISSLIMEGGLRVYTVLDVSSQLTAFKWVCLLIAMLFGVILFCLLRGADKISVRSTEDIDIIAEAFEQIKEGNLDSYISICSSTEFSSIGESYNLMLDSLKEQIEKNKEMVAHMAFAQIKHLESQINPHFLFNTLENIRVMCKIDPSKANEMIVNLSSILRYSISNAEEDVTVRKDIENTQSYLSLLKIRFNRRFMYRLEIDEDIMECLIPKLIIQPLIENAIKYGFGDRENLYVEIRGYREEDNLVIICRDDGVGIEEKTLSELRHTLAQPKNHSSHLGLYNIHKRIQLKYKGSYGMTIESERGKGTTLTLMLPVHEKGSAGGRNEGETGTYAENSNCGR